MNLPRVVITGVGLASPNGDDLAQFRKKGRNWTEKEKEWLLDKQLYFTCLRRQVMEWSFWVVG